MFGEKSKSVSFSRVYVCVKAKLTLVSSFVRTWKMLKNVQNAKEKTFHFITLSQEQLKVQYRFVERHRSMK